VLFQALTQISRHSIVYIAANALNRGAGFLTIPLVTMYVGGISNYGIVAVADLFVALTGQFLGSTIVYGMVRFYADQGTQEERSRVFSTAVILLFAIGLLFVVLSALFRTALSEIVFGDPGYGGVVTTLSFIVAFSLLFSASLAYFEAEQRSFAHSVITSSKTLLEIILKVIFLVLMGLTYMGVLYSVLVGELLFGAVLTGVLLVRLGIRFDPATALRLLQFAYPLALGGLCMVLVHQGDRYFIRIFDGLDAVGLYGLGYKIGSAVNALLYGGFATIWFPFVFGVRNDDALRLIFRKVLTYFIVISGFATLLLTAFSRELLWLLAPPSFMAAGEVLPLVAFGYMFWSIYQILHTTFFLKHKTILVFYAGLFAAVLNTLLNLVLVPVYGFVGAGWSTLCTYAALALYAYRYGQRLHRIDYELGRVAAATGLAVCLFLAARLTERLDPAYVAYTVSLKAMLCLAYPLILLSCGFLARDERLALTRMYRAARE
jgi:O-antigen/teichoic acid export membrane protein